LVDINKYMAYTKLHC